MRTENYIIILACLLCIPANAWVFGSHDYPATFVNEVARIYFLISCLVVCRRVLDKKEELADVIGNLSLAADECEKLQTIVGDFENLLRTKRSVFKYEDINEIIGSVIPPLEKGGCR